MKNFFRVFTLLLRAKYHFNTPVKNKLLIYDTLTREVINKRFRYSLLDTRKETLNLRIIIKNFFNFKFSFKNYIFSYIREVNPKLVLTLNDNDPLFFELKNKFPKIKFAAIQNGWRHLNNNSFKNKKLYIDYFFVFGKNSILYYKKYISCKQFIILGSFRNNQNKIKRHKIKKNILFVSNFRKNNSFLGIKNNKFKVEPEIINTLNNFCVNKNIKFYIACSSSNNIEIEKKYLLSQLPKKNNAIMLKKNKGRNYNHVDKFSTIMFIDSTLGYEAISRGKKIISISARKVKSKIYHPFGYPSFSKNSNFFFTNYNKQKNIYRIIKNVYEISSKEWKKRYFNTLKKLIVYNYDNELLYKKINKILN